MKNRTLTALVVMLAAASAYAQESPPPSQDDASALMKAMSAVMSGGTNAAAVVDFREMKALLPATLDGMKRTAAKGEKTGALGMTVSYAEATFKEESGGSITIKISDNSGIGGLMAAMQVGWSASEIDSETETGFERTTTYSGNKAHEQYDNEAKEGKIEIMVAGRFMVELNGSGVPFEKISDALKKIDLATLATLKPKAAEPQPAPAK